MPQLIGRGIQRDTEGYAIIWVDGTTVGNKAGGTIYGGHNHPINSKFKVISMQTSYNGEIQASKLALKLAPPENILIITDNKSLHEVITRIIQGKKPSHKSTQISIASQIKDHQQKGLRLPMFTATLKTNL